MPFQTSQTVEHPPPLSCRDLLEMAISKNTSVFDQLIYVASLWNEATKEYKEPLLERMFGSTEVDASAQKQHRALFQHWIELDIVQQVAELAWYLAVVGESQIVRECMESGSYGRLIPGDATEPERLLFATDMEHALRVALGNAAGTESRVAGKRPYTAPKLTAPGSLDDLLTASKVTPKLRQLVETLVALLDGAKDKRGGV
jgi:hypothetical protein